MRMVMAVVPRDQANNVMEALIAAGYTATFTDSRGGMLRQAQQMLFTAVRQKDLDQVLTIIRENCRTQIALEPVEDEPSSRFASEHSSLTGTPTTYIGSAVIFVWDIERFETY
jgi:uncharacterized protein YaaQ